MDLKHHTHNLLYEVKHASIPDSLARFRIICPEYSSHEVDIKPYPVPDTEHLFALLWDISSQHKVSATIIPTPTRFLYTRDFTPGMRTQMHSHEYLELFYVIEGEYRQKILGNEYIFHKGELCLIDKNCQHQEILGDSPATILFLGITNLMFDDVMERKITTERISDFLKTALLKQKSLQQYLHFKPLLTNSTSTDCTVMEEALSQLLTELERHDEASPYICQGLLLRVFHILSTRYDFSLSQKLRHEMNWILYEEISDYINKNLTRISPAMLTREFHFQEDYFNRLLKAQSGLTYTEFLQQCRLKRAEELLLSTDYNIDHIMELIGYRNKGYFYKIFAERYKLTPAQFRKKYK